MTYVIIQNLGKGTRFLVPWKALTFSFVLALSTRLGDPRSRPNTYILVLLNFSLYFSFIGTERMWDRVPTTSFPFILFSLIPFLLGREGVGSNPHSPTLIFILKFPSFFLEIMGLFPTCLNLLFLF